MKFVSENKNIGIYWELSRRISSAFPMGLEFSILQSMLGPKDDNYYSFGHYKMQLIYVYELFSLFTEIINFLYDLLL